LPEYTEAQFLGISEKVLPKVSSGLSRFIGSQIWQNGGDIRDVISVARLIRKNDSPEQVSEIINTMMKYRSGDCWWVDQEKRFKGFPDKSYSTV